MLIINGKMVLKVDNEVIMPGEKKDIPEKTAEKLVKVGLVEKATKSPTERAVMPESKEMTVTELKKILKKKNLPIYGTKAELIERLEGE